MTTATTILQPGLDNDSLQSKPSSPPDDQTLSILTGKEWFRAHPEKVLGEPYQTTDRFGKTVTRVKGNMDTILQAIAGPLPEEPVEP